MAKAFRQIRAIYDSNTIRVYQAYSDEIADAALKAGTFVAPFSMERMTWIKPSFLWMMYRSGYGYKDDNQKRILAIDITREGFEWALEKSCLSHAPSGMSNEDFQKVKKNAPIRIQWDPERSLKGGSLGYRSIQIGISRQAVPLYVKEWIKSITDVTEHAHKIYELVKQDKLDEASELLPKEVVYPINDKLRTHLEMIDEKKAE